MNADRDFLRALKITPCEFPAVAPEGYDFIQDAVPECEFNGERGVFLTVAQRRALLANNHALADDLASARVANKELRQDRERLVMEAYRTWPARWWWVGLLAAFVAGILAAKAGQ